MSKPNHYVIGKFRTEEGHTTFLGKVTQVDGAIISGYQEHMSHLPKHRKLFEIPVKDVALDFGPQPYPGKFLKFDTSSLYTGKKLTHDFFGDVYFFYKISKESGQMFMKSLDKAAEILRKAKLPEPTDTIWEVNPKDSKDGGKYSGIFRPSKDVTKMPDRFGIKPESMPATIMSFVYVILHEYAHWFHHHHIKSPKVNATWIKLFNTSIKPMTIDKETSKRILDSLVGGGERPSDFKGQLEEDDKNAFNWIIRTISTEHAVGIKELDCLFEAEQQDEIKSLWPKRTLHKKDLKPVVSEYACKNVKELLAESFAYHFTRQKIPANITSLLEKTLQNSLRIMGGN